MVQRRILIIYRDFEMKMSTKNSPVVELHLPTVIKQQFSAYLNQLNRCLWEYIGATGGIL